MQDLDNLNSIDKNLLDLKIIVSLVGETNMVKYYDSCNAHVFASTLLAATTRSTIAETYCTV